MQLRLQTPGDGLFEQLEQFLVGVEPVAVEAAGVPGLRTGFARLQEQCRPGHRDAVEDHLDQVRADVFGAARGRGVEQRRPRDARVAPTQDCPSRRAGPAIRTGPNPAKSAALQHPTRT